MILLLNGELQFAAAFSPISDADFTDAFGNRETIKLHWLCSGDATDFPYLL